MLVVYFMSSSYAPRIPIIGVSKEFETLMNKYIMNYEIT